MKYAKLHRAKAKLCSYLFEFNKNSFVAYTFAGAICIQIVRQSNCTRCMLRTIDGHFSQRNSSEWEYSEYWWFWLLFMQLFSEQMKHFETSHFIFILNAGKNRLYKALLFLSSLFTIISAPDIYLIKGQSLMWWYVKIFSLFCLVLIVHSGTTNKTFNARTSTLNRNFNLKRWR